jgi:hypothetical protein
MSACCRNMAMVVGMLFCSAILNQCAHAQDRSAVATPENVSDSAVLTNDTTGPARPVAAGAPDSLSRPAAGKAGVLAPQKVATNAEKKAEPLKLVKRTYGRKQVLLATVMMIFVVMIMTAAQQWNPR